MSSDPPPSAAEPTRSTRKRSAATEADPEVVDLDHDVSGTTVARGCHMSSWEIRGDPLRSKRLRRGHEELKGKGGPESSTCGCSRKRAREEGTGRFVKSKRKKGSGPLTWRCVVESGDEQGFQDRSGSAYDDEIHEGCNIEQDKQRMLKCQFFVNVGGSHISMQKNLNKTTVKMLVKSAYNRVGANLSDFYCTYAGKCLKEERFLSYYPIQRDSTIVVQHRLRAGVREQTIQCATWNDVIAGRPRFHSVALPPHFVDVTTHRATATFLSEDIQRFCIQVLVALCKIHIRGRTLNGHFGPEHILFYKGMVIFDDLIPEDDFSDVGGRQDYTRVFDVFEPVFRDEIAVEYPLHADHLLNFLFACPPNIDLRSPAVIAFLTNHPATQSYTERISTSKILDGMVSRLFGHELSRFRNIIGTPDWDPIENVPALNARLMFEATWDKVEQELVSTYGYDCRECALLAENYFKHTPPGTHLEVVEAAFSLAMSDQNFLPKLLQALAILDPPLQDPRFDVVKVFGNRVVINQVIINQPQA